MSALVFLPSFVLSSVDPAAPLEDLMRSAAAAYREGKYGEALWGMTLALERDPGNSTARNYILTVARKIQERDKKDFLPLKEEAGDVALARRDLEERREKTRQVLAKMEDSYKKSRNLRAPSDILSGLVGLDKYLGDDFEAERIDAQSKAYFRDILDNLSRAIAKGVFVSKRDQYRAEGYLAYYSEDWTKAKADWTLALRENPADQQIKKELDSLKALMDRRVKEDKIGDLTRQATVYEKTGNWAEAAKSWRDVLALDPERREARERAAVDRAASERKQLAARLANMTDEGMSLYQKGDYLGGAQKWLEVLQLDPSFDQARIWLAHVATKLGRFQAAPAPIASASANNAKPGPVVAKDKAKAEELYREGILLYAQDKLPQAVQVWEESARLDPEMANVREALKQAKNELSLK